MVLARSYIALMKLRVVELLLISTIPAMILAEEGIPDARLVFATLVGGTLAAGSANAFNMVLESDLDQLMKRTSKRPLVTGALSKAHAGIFASAIGILSLITFWFFTTPLATLFTAIAIAFYVLVYTLALKRHTSQNIVWGGAAGCMPVLIGWAAVTNSISWTAVAFFLVIFFWTPPHFWALAIKYKDDYEAASIPMLPVIAGRDVVVKNMWFYTVAMVTSSGALIYLAELQWWAMVITVGLGVIFAYQLIQLKEDADNYNSVAAKIFHWSITYLTLFSALLVAAQLLKA
jgi:protoheme IX farnesyltransferase